MDHPEAYVEAAERHLRHGEPLSAYNELQPALERWPGHTRLRQLQALALARSGDVERANAVLDALAREGLDDAETLGMLARTHKDLALRASDSQRVPHLQAAFDLYDRAYRAARGRDEREGAGYTGINAAAMAALSGDLSRARAIAGEVEELCRPTAAADYWSAATLGEAALIRGDNAAARAHYLRAKELAGRSYGDLGTTRRQARLLEAHLGLNGSASAILALPPVLAFTGHMIDRRDRLAPRFPDEHGPAVEAMVRARLGAIAPAAVYGSAACGADLICLEAASELGCETHVVLPFPPAAFREASVDYAGAEWSVRFEAALARADTVTIASDHRARESTATYEYANLILTGMARLRAQQLDTGVIGLAVHDPGAIGAPGGTASMMELWRSQGLPVEIVEIEIAARAAPQHRAEAPGPAARSARPAIRHEMRSLLFADAVGYSKLSEDQIPLYITEFLGAVAALVGRSRHRHEHVETAGDGLYMVFADPLDASGFALELSELAGGTDWSTHGLPAGFNLRVALHCGPVHVGRDPLTGTGIYTGPHTSRAARIEPITPPGQVYASSAFAAVAAASGGGLALTYVGRMPLAKGYGALGLYHVRGAA
jgi:tetratricopeptide (TPR) repeat protein